MYNTKNTVDFIKKVAKSKNIQIGKMLSDCELNKNTLSSMQSRGSWLQANALAKIADYLDCSVDYLLGRTDEVDAHRGHMLNSSKIINITERGNEIMEERIKGKVDCFRSLMNRVDATMLKKALAVKIEQYGYEKLSNMLDVKVIDIMNFITYNSYSGVVLEKLDVLFETLNTDLYKLLNLTNNDEFNSQLEEFYTMHDDFTSEINTLLGIEKNKKSSSNNSVLVDDGSRPAAPKKTAAIGAKGTKGQPKPKTRKTSRP